jgi:[ribosomal protein S18]-alanine N-acetyltransferase
MSTEALPLHPVVRRLSMDELDRVMEIERSAYPFPWTRGIFEDCLRVGYDCQGLHLGSSLIGYSVQTQAAGESHLLNLCIDPAWQGRRLGRLLLEQSIRLARAAHCSSMFLEVRPSNHAGISLYRKRGFQVVGERPDYYHAANGRENALVMRLQLDDAGADRIHAVPDHNPF